MFTHYMAFNPIIWDSTSNIASTISSNVLSGTGTGATAQSISALSETSSIQWTQTSGSSVVGMGHDPYTSSYSEVEFGFHYDASKWKIYESGTKVHEQLGTSTDTLKITINSTGSILYYVNGSLAYTSATSYDSTKSYYAHATDFGTQTITMDIENADGGTVSGTDLVNAHAHLQPLHIFRRQRDWF